MREENQKPIMEVNLSFFFLFFSDFFFCLSSSPLSNRSQIQFSFSPSFFFFRAISKSILGVFSFVTDDAVVFCFFPKVKLGAFFWFFYGFRWFFFFRFLFLLVTPSVRFHKSCFCFCFLLLLLFLVAGCLFSDFGSGFNEKTLYGLEEAVSEIFFVFPVFSPLWVFFVLFDNFQCFLEENVKNVFWEGFPSIVVFSIGALFFHSTSTYLLWCHFFTLLSFLSIALSLQSCLHNLLI